MSRKNLILILVFASATILTLIFENNQNNNTKSTLLETKILATKEINQVAKISLKNDQNQIELTKNESGFWLLNQTPPFPAKASAIIELLDKLEQTKLLRVIKGGTSNLNEYGLVNAPQIILDLKNQASKSITMGQPREGGGQFALVEQAKEKQVVLLDRQVNPQINRNNWESTNILSLDKESIQSFAYEPPTGDSSLDAFILSRKSEGKPLLFEKIDENRQMKSIAVNDLMSAISEVKYEDKSTDDNLPDQFHKIKLKTFNQTEFDLKVFVLNKEGESSSEDKEATYFIKISTQGEQGSHQAKITKDYISPYKFKISQNTFKKIIVEKEVLTEAASKNHDQKDQSKQIDQKPAKQDG